MQTQILIMNVESGGCQTHYVGKRKAAEARAVAMKEARKLKPRTLEYRPIIISNLHDSWRIAAVFISF